MSFRKVIWNALVAVLAMSLFSFLSCEVEASGDTSPSVTYTVSFHPNCNDASGSMAGLSGLEKTSAPVPECGFTRPNYTFENWNTAADGSGITYSVGGTIVFISDFTLYAQWKQNSQDNPEDPNGGDNPQNPDNPNNPDNPDNPQNPDNPDNPQNPDNPDNPPATKTFNVTFDAKNGTDAVVVEVEEGNTVSKPADPEKEGYKFLGWYIREYQGGAYFDSSYNFASEITKDISLWASWEIVKFEVMFFPGTDESPSTVSVDYGKTVSEPESTPKKTGYTFDGWILMNRFNLTPEKDADGKYIPFDFSTPVKMDYALGSSWKKNVYKVRLSADNGIEYDPIIVEYGSKIAEPATPEKIGHDFLGWFPTDSSIEEEFDFDTAVADESLGLEKDGDEITIYAGWDLSTYEIKFVLEDAAEGDEPYDVQEITYGEYLKCPETPFDGYKIFDAWYNEGKRFSFDTLPTDDMILVGKWETNEGYHVLTFEDYKGNIFSQVWFKDNDILDYWGNTNREFYNFNGWVEKGSASGELYDLNKPITESHWFVESWTPIEVSGIEVTLEEQIGDMSLIKQSFPYLVVDCEYDVIRWYVDGKSFVVPDDETDSFEKNTFWLNSSAVKNGKHTITVQIMKDGNFYSETYKKQ